MSKLITGIKVNPGDTTGLGGNTPYRGLEWHPTIHVEYNIYLYNISARTFAGFGAGKLGPNGMSVPGVEQDSPTEVTVDGKIVPGDENHRYRYITSFPHPTTTTKPNHESNEFEHVPVDGRRFVIDMINPDNVTLSLDTIIKPEENFSIGNNYAPRGIFFSYTNPPEQSAVEAAYKRMEAYYVGLNEKAAALELVDKVALGKEVQSNPDYVFAARYFGRGFSFTEKQTRTVECPNCGEQKPAGRKFHMASFGALCVEPNRAGWEAAINAGIKRKDDVPDDIRWWKPELAKV